MSMEAIIARSLDYEIWPPNTTTMVKYAVRKWKDRPAAVVGESVYIVKLVHVDTGTYTLEPRCLIRKEDGSERWVSATVLTSAFKESE